MSSIFDVRLHHDPRGGQHNNPPHTNGPYLSCIMIKRKKGKKTKEKTKKERKRKKKERKEKRKKKRKK